MRIGQLAALTGVSTQTIRYYENIGVLPEAIRLTNGYRNYDDTAVKRLSFIRDAQTAGLTLVEIQMILEMRDRGEATCGHVIGMLEHHLQDVDKQVAELHRTRSRLESLIERAKRLDPEVCTDPDRCQTISTESERK